MSSGAWVNSAENLRFEPYKKRDSLHFSRGHVVAKGLDLLNGTIEFDMASEKGESFLGVIFRLHSEDEFESIFFRPGQTGTAEAVQYQPNLNGSGTWEIFHGPHANAVATLPRGQWIHVKLELAGSVARLYLGADTKPTLTIPRLANEYRGGGIGFWTGPFGKGARFANLSYTRDDTPYTLPMAQPMAAGTIVDWKISQAVGAASVDPATLPDLATLDWQHVAAEPWNPEDTRVLGLVLLNRYRRAPNSSPPADADEVMAGRSPEASVVFARAVVSCERADLQRLEFGYSDGVAIHVNGQPLFFGMNPYPFRDTGGVMERAGEAVYVPLRKGRNEIVLAVSEFFGGWGFWARLEPLAAAHADASAESGCRSESPGTER